jgi:hypothetical protein
MANVQTQNVINRNASPTVMNNPAPLSGGGEMPDFVTVTVQATIPATVAAADTVELCRIPVTARVLDVQFLGSSPAATATTDVGLAVPGVSPAYTGGGSQTALCTTAALGGGKAIWTSIYGTGAKPTTANVGKMAWELAGATVDPSLGTSGPILEYVVVVNWTTITTPAGGAANFRITYQTR